MNHHIRRGYTMLVRAVQLALENLVDNDLAASLLAELQLRITGIEQTLGLQRHGHATMLGAAGNRQDHANTLRETMRDLARIARVLDPREYPDIATQMRTANLKVYSELLARAQCFIDAARPIKEVFIAYGAPADFLTRLESQIAAVNAAEHRKFNGQGERINATATLTEQTREAIRTLRKLQVIHANYYRDQPGLAAAWKAATHIERARKSKDENSEGGAQIDPANGGAFAAAESRSFGNAGDNHAPASYGLRASRDMVDETNRQPATFVGQPSIAISGRELHDLGGAHS